MSSELSPGSLEAVKPEPKQKLIFNSNVSNPKKTENTPMPVTVKASFEFKIDHNVEEQLTDVQI